MSEPTTPKSAIDTLPLPELEKVVEESKKLNSFFQAANTDRMWGARILFALFLVTFCYLLWNSHDWQVEYFEFISHHPGVQPISASILLTRIAGMLVYAILGSTLLGASVHLSKPLVPGEPALKSDQPTINSVATEAVKLITGNFPSGDKQL